MSYSVGGKDSDMAIKRQKKLRRNPVTASLERLYKIVEDHLVSLPEDEARKRLKAIDAAHSRWREPDSKIHASHQDTQERQVLSRSPR